MSAILEFLEKPGCHLCEDALPSVHRLARRLGLQVHRIDVEADDDLLAEFALRIPVVRLDGAIIAEGNIVYPPMLRKAKAALRR